jgi:ABC-type phosphate/phosphonate transport system substrate-binding protein
MNENKRPLHWLVAFVFLFFAMPAMPAMPAMAAKETLIFAAAPGDVPDAAGFYKPLLDLIAKASGKKVELQIPANYIEYAKNTRAGSYDLVFDASHFTAWRVARVGHLALARLPGDARIVVATRPDGPKSLDELASGRRVCVLPAPTLSNLAFEQLFQNPARQPVLVVARSPAELTDCLSSKRGEAAVFPSDIWEGVDAKELRVIPQPNPIAFPERTLTASGELEADLRAKVAAALLSEEGAKALAPFLKYYKAEKLVAPDAKAYEPARLLLQQAAGFQ